MTVMFEPGYELPPGMSYSEMELFVMTGYIEMDGQKHGPGTCICRPAGVSLSAMKTPRGITGLMFYNFGEPSCVESDEEHPLAERHKLIKVNAYDDMQWSSTSFFPATAPGCLVKVLKTARSSANSARSRSAVPTASSTTTFTSTHGRRSRRTAGGDVNHKHLGASRPTGRRRKK